MKNSPENKNFENQWKEAFDSAELKPSENVWKGVDAHLANKAAGNYKRGIVFYRWVAAASVLILISWGGYVFFSGNQVTPSTQEIVSTEQNSSSPEQPLTNEENLATIEEGQEGNGSEDAEGQTRENTEGPLMNSVEDNNLIANNTEANNNNNNNQNLAVANNEPEDAIIQDQGLTPTTAGNDPVFALNTDSENKDVPVQSYGLSIGDMEEPPAIALEGRPVWDFELEREEVEGTQGLWAGLDFAPGIFDPNFSNSDEAATNLAQDSFGVPVSSSVADDQVSQGFSYGISVNAGFPLSDRWILQSGVGYSVGNTGTSTSLIVEDANGARSALVFTNSEQLESLDNSVSLSAPTEVTSSYEFLSVPVRAGYAILDKKKMGLVLSAGISSDFLLQNTISTGQRGVGSFQQGSGSDSPFRPVYFSGLSSLTLTYRLGAGYMIMLEPSYKAAINTFSKSSELFESRPSNFGIGLGIRYQFKK